jgi:hypothetical protein
LRTAIKAAWSCGASIFLAAFLFLFVVAPARAPQGGKKFLGGRTIASQQEEDFDQRLLHYQLCYGVKFAAEEATLERRRVCKALLVHRLQAVLNRPGAYFREPLEFRCENTVNSRRLSSGVAVVMQPNHDFQAIDLAITRNLETANVGESADRFAREACTYLTDCKIAMNRFSLRKVGTCLSTWNVTHRKILLNEVGAMLFRAKGSQDRILYSDLLDEARL